MANVLLENVSMSSSLVVIKTVLDLDHVIDMVAIDLIGKVQKEIEVPLQDAVVDVTVHIVPNGLFGLITYHPVAGKVKSRFRFLIIYQSYIIMTYSKIIF